MNIEIYPKTIFKYLLYIILFLLCANIVGLVFKFYFGHNYVYGLVPLFDFNHEKNIPTLYSSIALILVSVLLLLIAVKHKKNNTSYLPWAILSIIFLFLSIDETATIHDGLIYIAAKDSLNTSGLFFYAWVIPYGIALIVFVIAYLKFLTNLPRNIMVLFIISGSIFVTGAIGFELIEGKVDELYGVDNLLYSILYTVEELLEMFGIALFIYTLLIYIVSQFGRFTITITENN